jgi:hypothetical protein
MRKISAIILLLVLASVAHAAPRAYLVSRSEAVKAITDANHTLALVEFTEGKSTLGKVALVIDGEATAEKIRNALIISLGIIFRQPEVKDCRVGNFRGEACTGDARGTRP